MADSARANGNVALPCEVSPRKLLFQSSMALGDAVMLTAAIRDLHRLYPGRFLTDVRTAFPELWAHNPYLTPLDALDPRVETVGCETPLINQSGQVAGHYLQALPDFLSRRLGLRLVPTEFRGDVHVSEPERAAPTPFSELAGQAVPYWLVSAGGKYDITAKWWATDRFQAVIDHFRGRIQFVQVGYVGHYHPRLEGVLDLRGRTDLRQLIRLVYNADGVLCGVTALMHLAAAVPRPPECVGLRPCVVIAGGREPPPWEAYPGHQFLHTLGALPCCAQDGCWKSRVRALGDGALEDEPQNRCVDIVGHLPRCMHLVTAQDVIRRIETYLMGGLARCLSPAQFQVASRAIRAAGPSGFENLPLTLSSARPALEAFLNTPSLRPPKRATVCGPRSRSGSSRGIVICGGGARYFTNAWVCINALRRLGCRLPIQVWHLGRDEMDSEMERLLAPLQVESVDASQQQLAHPVRHLSGWPLKPYAILFSPFREVLLLDADNVPVRDPTFLFDVAPFRESGALFWPDLGHWRPAEPVWRSCGLEMPDEPEFESGQIIVDKGRCWPALRLALWFNEQADFYYRHIHGDKETFHLAFKKLQAPYRLVPHPPQTFAGGLFQHDLCGRRLFQHRTAAKWTLMPHNGHVPGFQFEAECLADLERLRQRWDGRLAWLHARSSKGRFWPKRNAGRLEVSAWIITAPDREVPRRAMLASLAASDWRDLAVNLLLDDEKASERHERLNRQVLPALQQFLDGSADCLLLLDDSLCFNRHLRHNLEHWPLFARRQITLAGLHNPGFREIAFDVPGRAVAVAPEYISGFCALLIARPAAAEILAAWNTLNAPPDQRLAQLAAKMGRPLYYHATSLVQHQPQANRPGEPADPAADFAIDWRA